MSLSQSSIDLRFEFSSSPSTQPSSDGVDPPGSVGSSPPGLPSSAAALLLDGPDYSLWNETMWARFPNYCFAQDVQRARSWWWLHGYRLKQTDGRCDSRFLWVCARCVVKLLPPPRSKYCFIASTGRSVITHLRTHNISNRAINQNTTRAGGQHSGQRGGQLTIHEALGADLAETHQHLSLSDYAMAERALELRRALSRLFVDLEER
jgi:hypothetical protein